MAKGILEKLLTKFSGIFEEKKNKRAVKKKLKNEPIEVSFKELKNIEGGLEKFDNFIKEYGKIGIILGARGSGKSALGMRILENVKAKGKKAYALGFRKDRLPKWINPIENVHEIPNNSFLLADEAGIEFSSRSSMSSINKLLSDLLLISRHKNISIIFITQNCMPLTTKVITEKGVKTLKDIKPGEKLLSYNFKGNKLQFKRSKISKPTPNQKVIIEAENSEIIECSPEHKLLVRDGKRIVQKKARDLTTKDQLFKPL